MLDLFLNAARRFPEREAFSDDGSSMTYSEAQKMVEALSSGLSGSFPRGSACLVLTRKGSAFWPCALAAWKSGLTPAFVDYENLPPSRLATFALMSNAKVAIGSSADAARIGEVLPWVRLLCHDGTLAPPETGQGPPPSGSPSEDYIVFTSGSSGQPKAVRCQSEAAARVCVHQAAFMGLADGTVCGWLLRQGFDASLSDAGVCWAAGGTLRCLLASPGAVGGLKRWMAKNDVGYADIPPAVLGVCDPSDFPSLQTVLWGGEPISPAAAKRWASKKLFVAYGPTEAAICSHIGRCGPEWDEALIGSPVDGAEDAIVDGELWIGGANLAFEYVGNETLTDERFVKMNGSRWFRTGDAVRVGKKGGVVFVGRIDRQMKIRGVLWCPEELEAAAMAKGLAANCKAWTDKSGKLRFSASRPCEESLSKWRKVLAEDFPESALPSGIDVFDGLDGFDSCKTRPSK